VEAGRIGCWSKIGRAEARICGDTGWANRATGRESAIVPTGIMVMARRLANPLAAGPLTGPPTTTPLAWRAFATNPALTACICRSAARYQGR
jgi:hypothetical protein